MEQKYYTIRIDVPHRRLDDKHCEYSDTDVQSTISVVNEWIDQEFIVSSLVSFEVADKTGKPHLQGYFGVDPRIYDYQKIKNMWRDAKYLKRFKMGTERSCTSMNKESYKSYILKQKDIRIRKNISDKELEEIPQWEELTQKEKKESHRRLFYSSFLKYCQESDQFETYYCSMRWVAGKLVDFMGTQPLPEQIPWMKGVIFSAQSAFIRGKDDVKALKAREELIDRLLF